MTDFYGNNADEQPGVLPDQEDAGDVYALQQADDLIRQLQQDIREMEANNVPVPSELRGILNAKDYRDPVARNALMAKVVRAEQVLEASEDIEESSGILDKVKMLKNCLTCLCKKKLAAAKFGGLSPTLLAGLNLGLGGADASLDGVDNALFRLPPRDDGRDGPVLGRFTTKDTA